MWCWLEHGTTGPGAGGGAGGPAAALGPLLLLPYICLPGHLPDGKWSGGPAVALCLFFLPRLLLPLDDTVAATSRPHATHCRACADNPECQRRNPLRASDGPRNAKGRGRGPRRLPARAR